jgi:hypothetical protein
VYRSANQISAITTMNIPTLTHALSLQLDMICSTHRGRLGAARCQTVAAPPRLIPTCERSFASPANHSLVGRRKKGVLPHPSK